MLPQCSFQHSINGLAVIPMYDFTANFELTFAWYTTLPLVHSPLTGHCIGTSSHLQFKSVLSFRFGFNFKIARTYM